MSPQRRSARSLGLVALFIAFVAAAPLLCVALAGAIASSLGCTLSEVGADPCLVGGTDIAEGLYSLMMMGWFGLLTIWLAPVALVLGVIALVKWLRAPSEG